MNKTRIEWISFTLNPVVGCTFGCPYCYAKIMNNRFNKSPKTKKGYTEDWNKPKFFPERLKQLNTKKPRNIFMDSMSDIADWKDEWIHEVALAIIKNPQHNYLFLTKRINMICNRDNAFYLLLSVPNVWLGISVTNNQDMKRRLPLLRNFMYHKCHLFISIEPIHEYILSYNYGGIGWIIIGAETGKRKNKITPEYMWDNEIIIDAKKWDIPLFYKESMLPIVGEKEMFREFPVELRYDD